MDSSTSKASNHDPFLIRPKSDFFLPHKKQAIREALDHWFVTEKYQSIKVNEQDGDVVEKSGGACKVCDVFTTNKCQTCNEHYCVNDCQHPNWKKHEMRCSQLSSTGFKSPSSNTEIQWPTFDKEFKSAPAKELRSPISTKDLKSPTSYKDVRSPTSFKDLRSPTSFKDLKSPTCNKDFEEDEKLMTDNSSPFRKLTEQIKHTPRNGTTSPNILSGRKSEPTMGKNSTNYQQRDRQGNQKRLSLSECEAHLKELENSRKRSLGKTNQNKTFSMGSSSSTETDSVSNAHSSRLNRLMMKDHSTGTKWGEAKKVVFLYKELDTSMYWVMDDCDLHAFESVHNALAKECDDYEWVKPEVGLVCGCKYSDEWYRARVIALQPKCRVHFIDYGNSEEVPSSSLKKLPPEIRMVKNLVYRIDFDSKTAEEYKNKDLTGKTLKVVTRQITVSGVEVVRIVSHGLNALSSDSEAEADRRKEVTPVKKSIHRSAMSLVNSEGKGLIRLLAGDGMVRYGLIIPEEGEKEIELDIMETKSFRSEQLKFVKAAEGDYVLVVDYDEERRRGKVLSKLSCTYYVLLIDYGIVIMVDRVFHLPGRRANLTHLGVNVIITEIMSPEKVSAFSDLEIHRNSQLGVGGFMNWTVKTIDELLYQVTGEQDSRGRWPCDFMETSSEEVIAKGYIQAPPEEGVTVPLCLPIESGSLCEMTVVTGVRTCFVRPLDEQVVRKNLEMSVKMSEFLMKADPLTQPPEVGKMYAARNKKDDCFHRAVIKSARGDKLEVLFVDYGTLERVDMKDLKPLPVSIKVVPFFATEVTLAGITVERLSPSANQFLQGLIDNNRVLILKFAHGETEEVLLKERQSGIIVNEMIEHPGTRNNMGERDEERRKEGEMFYDEREEEEVEQEEYVERERVRNEESDSLVKAPEQATGAGVILKSGLKLPNIRVDETYALVLQYINEEEFFSTLTFWMANTEDETVSLVSNVTNSAIAEYCNQARTPYHPKVQEMCLAMYEGEWYRALTLSVDNDNYEVFFVDFGNTYKVKAKEIRKMNPEFMEYPAWAFKCTIAGVGKLIGKPGLKRTMYNELLQRVNRVIKNVFVCKYEFDIYHVAIPEIESVLSA